MSKIDATKIFSKTVDYYNKSRPTYPIELLDFLEKNYGVNTSHMIADIGSGTGIFTKLLLGKGYHVTSVEPNNDMRRVAEKSLTNYQFYKSIAASAESTELKDNSIDVITVATAFHWFNPQLTKCEFKRILKSDGICLLVWNIRDSEFPVMQDYELMMRQYVSNYEEVVGNHYSSDDVIIDFFSPNRMDTVEFPNVQSLDLDGFKGRILSTSYSPKLGENNYEELLIASEDLFNSYQSSNMINLHYKCRCYIGKL